MGAKETYEEISEFIYILTARLLLSWDGFQSSIIQRKN